MPALCVFSGNLKGYTVLLVFLFTVKKEIKAKEKEEEDNNEENKRTETQGGRKTLGVGYIICPERRQFI